MVRPSRRRQSNWDPNPRGLNSVLLREVRAVTLLDGRAVYERCNFLAAKISNPALNQIIETSLSVVKPKCNCSPRSNPSKAAGLVNLTAFSRTTAT